MCLPHIAYCAANLAAVEYEIYNRDGSMVKRNLTQKMHLLAFSASKQIREHGDW